MSGAAARTDDFIKYRKIKCHKRNREIAGGFDEKKGGEGCLRKLWGFLEKGGFVEK